MTDQPSLLVDRHSEGDSCQSEQSDQPVRSANIIVVAKLVWRTIATSIKTSGVIAGGVTHQLAQRRYSALTPR
jgi:hypothetical protein